MESIKDILLSLSKKTIASIRYLKPLMLRTGSEGCETWPIGHQVRITVLPCCRFIQCSAIWKNMMPSIWYNTIQYASCILLSSNSCKCVSISVPSCHPGNWAADIHLGVNFLRPSCWTHRGVVTQRRAWAETSWNSVQCRHDPGRLCVAHTRFCAAQRVPSKSGRVATI